MKRDVNIEVHHVTRVEGHGSLHAEIRDGRITHCDWRVVEAPRFFEAMVRGRTWEEMHHIVARICGICSIGHTLASIKATESAFGITVSEQTLALRKLALHGENLQSHVLHLGYLVLPDLSRTSSVLPLAESRRDELLAIMRLHRLANELSGLIGGRTTHPLRLIPGGMAKLPSETELREMTARLRAALPDLWAVTRFLKTLGVEFIDYERPTEYVALTSRGEYALYDGRIGSSDGGSWPVAEYRAVSNEYDVHQSTAKYCKHNRESYMVGALARFNLNQGQLSPQAAEAARFLGLAAPSHRPFDNNLAQLVECFHNVEDGIRLAEELLGAGLRLEEAKVTPLAGRGVGSVEVPRGVLFHDYAYDENGRCLGCNIVIPTNQNHANLALDLQGYLPRLLDLEEDEIKRRLQMLIRAYDPCISCSTHLIVRK
ncbi:MAG: Ni/Fe hydrogenase subunit alpha [Pseudomonadota bacterium]